MKTSISFSILFCMISMFLMSCEKAEIQSTKNPKQSPITSRGDCDDCPDTDQCCCYVAIDPTDNNNSASISLCGTDGGPTTCSPFSHNCFASTWSSNAYNLSLSSPSTARQDFCMLNSAVIQIVNTSSTDPATIKFSCTRGQTNPQVLTFTLSANGRVQYETGSDCLLTLCE
jgi:hypothetical protein